MSDEGFYGINDWGKVMKDALKPGIVAVFLITIGIVARLGFRDIPNFTPIAAIAMFAGYYFHGRRLAMLIPIASLAFSDIYLSSYEWPLRAIVYGSLAMPFFFHGWTRGHLNSLRQGSFTARLMGSIGLVGLTAISSLGFYLTTNLATWAFTPWYSQDLQGLAECMFAGLPFFKFTLAGDLTFGFFLFGAHQIAVSFFNDTAESSSPAVCQVGLGSSNG